MDEFIELLRNSTIIQGLVTLILIGTVSFLFINDRPVPELLSTLTTAVLAFWFGQKTGQSAKSIVRELRK